MPSVSSVQTFVTPTYQSYYLNNATLQSVAQALDRNRDNVLGQDELNMSPQMFRQMDRNNDRQIQLFELSNALTKNEVSIGNFSYTASEEIARVILADWVYTSGLGSLGQVLDQNNDGFVNTRELSVALNRGDVALSGSYLVAMNNQPNQPNYPNYPNHPNNPNHPPVNGPDNNHPVYPFPGNGHGLQEANQSIQGLESNKMKKDKWGNYDASTGIFTWEEANQRIKGYLEKSVLNANDICLNDKLALIKGQKMAKDKWGNYDLSLHSLTWEEASQMAEKAAKEARVNEYEPNFAQNYVTSLVAERMQADKWGNDDFSTGLLTPKQLNSQIKSFLQGTVLPSRNMNKDEKLALIRAQMMQKDKWGNFDPRTGALTADEVNQFSKQLFNSDFMNSQAFKAAA